MRANYARKNLSLRVPSVMDLGPFGQKTLASALTSPRQCRAPAFCFHPRTKTMLALSRSFRWLVGAFHEEHSAAAEDLRAAKVGQRLTLSIIARGDLSFATPSPLCDIQWTM